MKCLGVTGDGEAATWLATADGDNVLLDSTRADLANCFLHEKKHPCRYLSRSRPRERTGQLADSQPFHRT
jgi:hypothetical protein